MNTPIPGKTAKLEIDNTIRKKKNGNKNGKMHPTTNILNISIVDLTKQSKKILNISRSHLTRLMSVITGFNCLSYIQFKANPTINPLCRLCEEDNETFWHFITDCPRLQTYHNDTFLDKLPQQDTWKLRI